MFEVGKIVWYIDPREARVKVCKVVEEIIKKTLDGEEKNYVFLLWAGRDFKRISKSKLPGDFYLDGEEAKDAMMRSAEAAIDNMIQKAQTEAGDLIKPSTVPSVLDFREELSSGVDTSDVVRVTLEDGTVARVRGL